MNTTELLKIFYGQYIEDEKPGVFYSYDDFGDLGTKFKVLEVEIEKEVFFENFVITENNILLGQQIINSFNCIVEFNGKYYVYEIDEDYNIWLNQILEDEHEDEIELSEIYKIVEENEEDYEILNSKKDILFEEIFKIEKYRYKKMFNKKIDYIKL